MAGSLALVVLLVYCTVISQSDGSTYRSDIKQSKALGLLSVFPPRLNLRGLGAKEPALSGAFL